MLNRLRNIFDVDTDKQGPYRLTLQSRYGIRFDVRWETKREDMIGRLRYKLYCWRMERATLYYRTYEGFEMPVVNEWIRVG